MRGKGLSQVLVPEPLGITPAYAGKSEEIDRDAEIQRDHPRICGEKDSEVSEMLSEVGSPPHMRGKVQYHVIVRPCCGITPAYAGKSTKCWLTDTDKKDHPRICGEKAGLRLRRR